MASPRAILRATKAVPGAVPPTAAPQGGWQPMTGYAPGYGGFLPRPPSVFTQGAFGPFSPILPVPVDTPGEGLDRPDPRREEYEVGWNLPTGQPGTEGIKLASFGTLRTLADLYSVARACIQLRKAEIRGLDWDIVPTAEAAKANKGDKGWAKDFGERKKQAVGFFRRPDPDYYSWNSWLDAMLEEVFVFDALSLFLRPKKGKGMGKGLLGSDLDSLELISGPTIRPLYDVHGGYPRPPAPAYQQYLYGVPRGDFTRIWTGRDIDEAGLSDAQLKEFDTSQLLYLPMVPRRWTPYGFPPVERALIPVMAGLQKQGFQLDYFREGTVPAIYMSPGDETMTPNQCRELQDAMNAVAGDPAWHHKVIVTPPNTHVYPQRDAHLADQFDEVVMSQVCMAFDVQPMELGIMPKVSASVSPGASNQMAKATASIQERKATKPLLQFLSDIFNGILQWTCGQDDMEFVFMGLQEEEDEEKTTGLLVQQFQNGFRSLDECRDKLGLEPWGMKETSEPVIITPTGPVPFAQAMANAAAQPAQPTPGGGAVGGGGPVSIPARLNTGKPKPGAPAAPAQKPQVASAIPTGGGSPPKPTAGPPTSSHAMAEGAAGKDAPLAELIKLTALEAAEVGKGWETAWEHELRDSHGHWTREGGLGAAAAWHPEGAHVDTGTHAGEGHGADAAPLMLPGGFAQTHANPAHRVTVESRTVAATAEVSTPGAHAIAAVMMQSNRYTDEQVKLVMEHQAQLEAKMHEAKHSEAKFTFALRMGAVVGAIAADMIAKGDFSIAAAAILAFTQIPHVIEYLVHFWKTHREYREHPIRHIIPGVKTP